MRKNVKESESRKIISFHSNVDEMSGEERREEEEGRRQAAREEGEMHH